MPSPPSPPRRQRAPASPSPSPSSGSPPTVTTGPIPDAVLRAVLAADEAMYPAALPWARLRAWVDACPALAVCFSYHHRRRHDDDEEEEDAAVGGGGVAALGASITLPLRAGPWRALLAGRLAEPAIAPADLAVPTTTTGDPGKEEARDDGGDHDGGDHDGDGGVGLHVFHVERFDVDDVAARQAGRGLAARALRHALDVAAGQGWKVLGCSALTATDAGARAFAKLSFEPTGYEEIWVREVGGPGVAAAPAPARMVPVLPSGPAAGGEGAVRERGSHEEVVGEARMVVRYSDGVRDGAGLI